jgi:hypothetical protein
VVAVGHTILVNVYYLLVREGDYQDLGAPTSMSHRAVAPRRLVRRLEALGHAVRGYIVQLQLIA